MTQSANQLMNQSISQPWTLGNKSEKPSLTSKTPIADVSTKHNQGIVLLRQSDLQSIYEKSGPLAKNNEFQVHFWAINFRARYADNSIIDITIPTVYFNYKQEVSSAHIDFEMSDVVTVSEKAAKLHHTIANRINNTSFATMLEQLLRTSIEVTSTDYNSIHRHPCSSKHQSFSSTDLKKDPDNHGIVYSLESGAEKPNFAGIMAIDSGVCNLAHMEYRVVNGEVYKDLTYKQSRCHAIVLNDIDNRSMVEQLLGAPHTDYRLKTVESAVSEQLTDSLLHGYKQLLPHLTHATILVNEANIAKKEYPKYDYSKVTNPAIKKPDTSNDDAVQASKLMLEDKSLHLMSAKSLRKHLMQMDKLVYPELLGIEDYMDLTKDDLIEAIKDGYADLIDIIEDAIKETDDETSYELDAKAKELLGIGVPQQDLFRADKTQIDKWYQQAFTY